MSSCWFYFYLLACSATGIACLLMGLWPLALLFLAWPVTWLGLTLIDLTVVQPCLSLVQQVVTQYPLACVLAMLWGIGTATFLLLAIDEKETSR